MCDEIISINKAVYDWYLSLDKKDSYTCPYLIVPEESYFNAQIKVLVLGKETNGWGEKEECKTQEDLECLYINKIIKENIWGDGIPFWEFYFNHLKPILSGDVGVCVSNVSLLGYGYGKKGYNVDLAPQLSSFLERYIDVLSPNIIICFAGFGTKSRTEIDYLKILEPIFGQYDRDSDLLLDNNNWPLRKLSFKSSFPRHTNLYGTRHPERAGNEWAEKVCTSIKRELENFRISGR